MADEEEYPVFKREEEPATPPTTEQYPVFTREAAPSRQEDYPVFTREEPKTEGEGKVGTALREAAHEAPGVAGAVVGGRLLGPAIGAGLGRIAGGLLGSWAGPAGTVAGGLVGGYAGEALASAGAKLLGYDDSHTRAVNEATNPTAAAVGRVGGVLPFFGPGAATRGARVAGAALMGGLEAGQEVIGGREISPASIAEQAATGAFLTRPTALSERIEAGAGRIASKLGFPGQAKPAAPAEDVAGQGGTAGSTAAAGTAEEPKPTADTPPSGAENAAVRAPTPGPENYAKVRATPAYTGIGTEGGYPVDPTIGAALKARAPAPAAREAPPAIEQRIGEAIGAPPEAPPIPPAAPVPPTPAAAEAAGAGPQTAPAVAEIRIPENIPQDPTALRRLAAGMRRGGAEGRARQFEQAADIIERRGAQQQAQQQQPTLKFPRAMAAEAAARNVPPSRFLGVPPLRAEEPILLPGEEGWRTPLTPEQSRAVAAEPTALAGPPLSPTGGARPQSRFERAQAAVAARGAAPPGAPPPGAPPPGAPPPPPPPPSGRGQRPPPETLVPEGRGGDARAYRAAGQLDDELHGLTAQQTAEYYRYRDLVQEASKSHPELRGTGGEQIYWAIENGSYDQLPAKLREGYEKVANELNAESDKIRDQLIKDKVIDPQPTEKNYVHRIIKSEPARVTDPITGETGSLPGMYDASAVKELGFRGAQAKDGSRLVISSGDDGISIWNNRTSTKIGNPKGEPLVEGDKFTYKGKQYTADRGLTDEIEQHAAHRDGTPVEYHKNALLSAIDRNREMIGMQRYQEFMNRFKSENSPFKNYMTRDSETARARGWKESEVPELKGLYMHPNLEQAIHNNYNPGIKGMPDLNWARALNQFAVRSIFWNPVPHSMNSLMHYIVGRGWDWFPGAGLARGVNRGYSTWVRSMLEGFKSAITQDELLQELNRSGTSLVMSKIDSQNLNTQLGKILGTDLKNNPGPWEQTARDWGVGRGIDLYNMIMNGSQRALWTFSDALMAARVRELEMGGMSRPDAIAHARVHMPDYRLPIQAFGTGEFGRMMVRGMSDRNLSIFGRYHMGVFSSLGNMITNALGPNASKADRIEALGNMAALATLGLVVKPALDGVVQMFTDNKHAEMRPRGPLAPLTNAYDVAMGKRDIGMALGNIFTFSPAVKMMTQLLANRDFAGREIMQKGSRPDQKLTQLLDYGAGNIFSPYGTFGPALQSGTSKGNILHELMTQVTDTKVPTTKQIAGEKYGEQQAKKEAAKRAKRPRGLIEYGYQQVAPR